MTATEREARKNLADFLQLTLDQLRINQTEAGKRCTVSNTTVNKILHHQLVPTEDTMGAMDEGLGTGRRLRDLANVARAADKKPHSARPPQQVPPPPVRLLHRDTELRHLRDLIDEHPLLVLTGSPGVGKTALARAVAHQAADTYPNGTLHANLMDPRRRSTATDPAAILYRWLIALGIPNERIPDEAENRRSLLNNRITGSRVLVTLDNASEEDQVLSLLPETPGCTVLITSNRRLPGLRVHDGAQHHTVKPLTIQASVDLLGYLLGEGEPRDTDALREIAACCDGLPLALAAAGELVTTHGVQAAAARLASRPLAAMDAAIGSVGTGLDTAYRAAWHRISQPAQQLLTTLAHDDTNRAWDDRDCDVAGELRREHLADADRRVGVLLRDWVHHHAPETSSTAGAALTSVA